MPFPPKPDIPGKVCKNCGEPLVRKRYRNSLESYDRYLAREHCSQACANSKPDVGKSAHHYRAQKHKKPACEECGATDDLHVHHADGNYRNDDPGNLVTLCATCHLELHWREDRDRRVAAIRAAVQRPMRACEVCDEEFRPMSTGARTCSAGCKSVLLSWTQPLGLSGHRGVYWDGARKKWHAQARRGGRFISAGRYDSLSEAVAAITAIGDVA